jgi:hypothetical protein
MMKYKNARTSIEVEQQTKTENPDANETDVKELAAIVRGDYNLTTRL